MGDSKYWGFSALDDQTWKLVWIISMVYGIRKYTFKKNWPNPKNLRSLVSCLKNVFLFSLQNFIDEKLAVHTCKISLCVFYLKMIFLLLTCIYERLSENTLLISSENTFFQIQTSNFVSIMSLNFLWFLFFLNSMHTYKIYLDDFFVK